MSMNHIVMNIRQQENDNTMPNVVSMIQHTCRSIIQRYGAIPVSRYCLKATTYAVNVVVWHKWWTISYQQKSTGIKDWKKKIYNHYVGVVITRKRQKKRNSIPIYDRYINKSGELEAPLYAIWGCCGRRYNGAPFSL